MPGIKLDKLPSLLRKGTGISGGFTELGLNLGGTGRIALDDGPDLLETDNLRFDKTTNTLYSQNATTPGTPICNIITDTINGITNLGERTDNTVYVKTETDFGDIIIIGGDEYYQLDESKVFILQNDINWTRGFSLENDADIVIKSASKYSAKLLWNGFSTLANPIIRETGSPDTLVLQNIEIINQLFGNNNFFMQLTNSVLLMDNVRLAGFNHTLSLDTIFQISNSEITGLANDGITIAHISRSYISKSRILGASIGAGEHVILITGSSSPVSPDDMFFSDNHIQNPFGSYAFRIDSGLQTTDTMGFFNNVATDAALFFDISAGGIDQTDSRITTFSNLFLPDNTNIALSAPSLNGALVKSNGVATKFLNGTGGYSVPGGAVAANVIYVTTQDDFSPTTVVIGGDNYLEISLSAIYVVLNDFTMTKGLTFAGDPDVLITSEPPAVAGDYTPTITWNGFTTPANPIILSGGSLDNFTIQALKFNNIAGGTNYFCDVNISTSNLVKITDNTIGGFSNVFDMNCQFQITNNKINSAINELRCVVQDKCYFHNNNLFGISTTNNIVITGTGTNRLMTFSNNTAQNTDSNFFSIDSAIDSTSQINIFNNKTSVPAQFFDKSVSTIHQTDARVFSWRNLDVTDSSIVANTIFVRQESDLPTAVSIITSLGTFDFHNFTSNTKVILLNNVTLTNGIAFSAGANLIITSENKDSAKLLSNLSGAASPLFYSGASGSLTVEDISIENQTAGLTNSIILASGVANYTFIRSQFSSFAKIGEIASAGGLLYINNCFIEELGVDGLEFITSSFVRIINNLIFYNGTNEIFKFSGVSQAGVQIMENRIVHGSGFFLNISNSLLAGSIFQISDNLSFSGDDFFNTAAGSLDQTDVRIDAQSNWGIPNSHAEASMKNNTSVPFEQVIPGKDTAVTIKGLDWTPSALNERFTFANTNAGQADNQGELTYTGKPTSTFKLEGRATVDSTFGTDIIGIGFFKNGVAISDSFFSFSEPGEFRLVVLGHLESLTTGDIITLGIVNNTDASNIDASNVYLTATALNS